MESKIDFRKLKLSIPIEKVLEHYGVQVRRSNGSQLVADCPLPTHTSKESRNSMKLNSEKNIWCCMSESCVAGFTEQLGGKRGGDVLDLVALKEGVTILQAAKLLLEWFPASGEANGSGEKIEPSPSAAQPPVAGENKPLQFALKGISYCDYLEKRGITRETAAIFGAGFFPGKGSMAGRVVIPIHSQTGDLLAYAGRALNGLDPKYLLPGGFLKHLLLFNLHRISDQADTVVVVEGFFSVFWLTQCGFPNVVSIMGHSISDEQLALLKFRNVILMLDTWEDGQAVRETTTVRIASRCFVRAVPLPRDKQPDDISRQELHILLDPLIG